MIKEKIDVSNEIDIILNLIMSNNFCKEIIPILRVRDLELDYARIIATWIIEYYNKFNESPKNNFMKLYRSHTLEIDNDDLRENILTFIQKVDNYEINKNEDFSIQEAIRYLKGKNLKNLSLDIESYIVSGDIDKAESLITKYRKIEKNSGDSVDILTDYVTITDLLTEEKNKLFSFRGAYGKLVGDIHREDFIAFVASMKVGKTFTLIDCGIEALKNGYNVVFFSLEMSLTNMVKRIWKTLSGHVMDDIDITIPFFVENGDKYTIAKKTIQKKTSESLDIEKQQKKLRRLFRGGNFKVFAEPAYSLTVEKLETKLDDLNHDGFIPDVIIIDYADIMLPSNRSMDYRNQLDDIWKRLRALAQKRKCAVFTASQANRSAINKEVGAESISEDIRKLAHVTSMVSISKDDFCRKNSLAMFTQLAVREGEPITDKVIATQCLSLGRSVLDSRWKDDVIIDSTDNIFTS